MKIKRTQYSCRWDPDRSKIEPATQKLLAGAQTISPTLPCTRQPTEASYLHRPDGRRTDRRPKARDPQVREEVGACRVAKAPSRHSIRPGWRLEGSSEITQGNGRRFETEGQPGEFTTEPLRQDL